MFEAGVAVAHVGGLDHELHGKFLLQAETPALRVGVLAAVSEEADALSDIGEQAAAGARRLQQSGRQRIGVGGDEAQAVVQGGLNRRGQREAGLVGVAVVDADGGGEDAVAAANDGLRPGLVGEAEAGLEVLLFRRPVGAAVGSDVGEGEPAHGLEGSHRQFGHRVLGVVGARGVIQRVGRGAGEVDGGAVEALRHGRLVLVAQAEIEGQFPGDLPIVGDVEREVFVLLDVAVGDSHAAGGDAHEHGRGLAATRGIGGGVVGLHVVGVVVQLGREHRLVAVARFAVHAELRSEAQCVIAARVGEVADEAVGGGGGDAVAAIPRRRGR